MSKRKRRESAGTVFQGKHVNIVGNPGNARRLVQLIEDNGGRARVWPFPQQLRKVRGEEAEAGRESITVAPEDTDPRKVGFEPGGLVSTKFVSDSLESGRLLDWRSYCLRSAETAEAPSVVGTSGEETRRRSSDRASGSEKREPTSVVAFIKKLWTEGWAVCAREASEAGSQSGEEKHSLVGWEDDEDDEEANSGGNDDALTPNQRVYNELRRLEANLEADNRNGGNEHRERAYKVAMNALKRPPYGLGPQAERQVESGAELTRGKKGLGKGTKDKVDEILRRGSLRRNEELEKDEDANVRRLFKGVWGCSTATAKKWIRKGYTRLEHVLEGEGHLLNNRQRAGLRYYNDLHEKVPRNEILWMEGVLANALNMNEHMRGCRVEAVGSFRRGRSHSSDMDFLVTPPESFIEREGSLAVVLEHAVGLLDRENFIVDREEFPVGDACKVGAESASWLGLCRPVASGPVRRLDIKAYAFPSFGCAKLYFTGSKEFNRALRFYAACSHVRGLAAASSPPPKRRRFDSQDERVFESFDPPNSFKLDDKELVPVYRRRHGTTKFHWRALEQDRIPCPSERSVFDALGLAYVPPHSRELFSAQEMHST